MEQLGWASVVLGGMATVAFIVFIVFLFLSVDIGMYIEAKAKKIEAEAEAIRRGKKEAEEC